LQKVDRLLDTYILQLLVAVGAKIILENNYTKATFVRDIALGGPPKVDVRKRGRGGGRAKTDICGQGGLGGQKIQIFCGRLLWKAPYGGCVSALPIHLFTLIINLCCDRV
jgi:hypothetical protein